MNKKTKTVRAKRINLALTKETVATLTGDMLRNVAGGAIPETRHSECDTACLYC